MQYYRERLELADGDFVDLDWSLANQKEFGKKPGTKNNQLVILTHGMEGSSHSKYILHTVCAANAAGTSAVAWNMRGCSGEPNRALHFYHSGRTEDLAAVVRHALAKGFKKIWLAGFSLGGNLTLLYAAREGKTIAKEIQSVAAVCAPVDLVSSQAQIEAKENRLYLKRFLRDFHAKFNTKTTRRGYRIDTKKFAKRIRTLGQLDAHYTAPWNGFPDEKVYYQQCSSLPVLNAIRVPALLLNPIDDPFLSRECYPQRFAGKSKNFTLEMPETGGHCAMLLNLRMSASFMEKRLLEFFKIMQ
ncbi:YheT family hydrolase [Turneriella parva]|uniref:Alpha/beta hydrolase fold containing protein n=1 Tax=Turneriella parva (strain ATCC BAA-1111 / DSM 21527 / NCTC 11395 / H) TaxID=869212 RepID=I4B3Z6_TURPD|nr:alpha/beta fold hydrolase [Turneriella parva]AFM12003.1 alpha/beta hydrolase fold containing protein [Turneriella parva DSM 21527]